MMWLNEKQYAYVVQVTVDWTMDQLVALTNTLASTEPTEGIGPIKHIVENIAQL